MGPSPIHASSVPLLLRPHSGAITPNYHVVFDDWFATVAPALWTYLTLALLHDISSLVTQPPFMTMTTQTALNPQMIPLQCLQQGRLRFQLPLTPSAHPPLFRSLHLLSRFLLLPLPPSQCLHQGSLSLLSPSLLRGSPLCLFPPSLRGRVYLLLWKLLSLMLLQVKSKCLPCSDNPLKPGKPLFYSSRTPAR